LKKSKQKMRIRKHKGEESSETMEKIIRGPTLFPNTCVKPIGTGKSTPPIKSEKTPRNHQK